jgi:hypothetical protein
MSFEFEVTRDLPAKPGNCQGTGSSAKAKAVNSLAIGVLSQGPEKEPQKE